MSEENKKPDATDERLPYEPPAVISEEVFETLALSCAKGNKCAPNPANS